MLDYQNSKLMEKDDRELREAVFTPALKACDSPTFSERKQNKLGLSPQQKRILKSSIQNTCTFSTHAPFDVVFETAPGVNIEAHGVTTKADQEALD